MAYGSVEQWFKTTYEDDFHEAFQRRGAKLRPCVRVETGVTGSTHYFNKVGKGTATDKARHADVVPMNVGFDRVGATLSDKFAPQYVDKLDQLKHSIDERRAVANAGSFALGRDIDSKIITALDGASATAALTTTSSVTLRNDILGAIEALNTLDVPDDGDRWAVICPKLYSWMLTIPQFSSSDYVADADQPYGDGAFYMVKRWLGMNWMQHSGLTKATNARSNYFFHKQAVGLAIGADITAAIDWIPQKVAWLINHYCSTGSVLIDDEGVVIRTLDETDALPTS